MVDAIGYSVCGFSGVPVVGAVGGRAPIVYDENTQRYAVVYPDQGPEEARSWYPLGELVQHAEQLFLTSTHTHAYSPGILALYVHQAFLDGVEPLVVLPPELRRHEPTNSWVGYLSREAQAQILAGWVCSLVPATDEAWNSGDVTSVLRLARRVKTLLAVFKNPPEGVERRMDTLTLACAYRLNHSPLTLMRELFLPLYGEDEFADMERQALAMLEETPA